MKLALKKRQVVTAGAVLALILGGLALSRTARNDQPGKLDNAAFQACNDFAAGYERARTKTARLALADKVYKSSAGSDNKVIADRAAAMGRSAGDGTQAWKSDAEAFTAACRDTGWNPGGN